jgi:hypothetical protein
MSVSLAAFYDMCDKFDWAYEQTDCHEAWLKAVRRRNIIISLGSTKEHRDMWNGFIAWAESGVEKPVRPTEEGE